MKRAAIALTALLLAATPSIANEPQQLPELDACKDGDSACAEAEKAGLKYLQTEGAQRPMHLKLCQRLYGSTSLLARCLKDLNPDTAFDVLPMPDRDPESVCKAFYEKQPDTVLDYKLCAGREEGRRQDLLAVWDTLPEQIRFMCGWGIIDREVEIPLYTSITICVAREIEKSQGKRPKPFSVPIEYMSKKDAMRELAR